MLMTGLVMATLALGAHGERPREEKFVGTLVDQAPSSLPSINAQAFQQEIAEVLRTRPSMVPGTVVLSIGGGVAAIGAVVVILGVASGGFGGLGVALLGLLVGAGGVVVMIVGAIVFIVAGVQRGVADEKVASLKLQLSQLPPEPQLPPPPPPGVFHQTGSTILLARF